MIEILADVRDIVAEIRRTRIACPSCAAVQPPGLLLDQEQWRRVCGAAFLRATCRTAGIRPPMDDNIWPVLKRKLETATPADLFPHVLAAIKGGCQVEALYTGVWQRSCHGWPLHILAPWVRFREESEIDPAALLCLALSKKFLSR